MPPYADRARGEDTPVIRALLDEGRVVAIDQPGLYVYVYHGANTWDRGHFERNLVAHATRLAPHEDAQVRALLAGTARGS